MDRCRIITSIDRAQSKTVLLYQIYYANTLTGKLSRDLPGDSDDDVSDGDLVSFTQFQSAISRSGSSSGLRFVTGNNSAEPSCVRDATPSQANPPEPAKINDTAHLSLSSPAVQANDTSQTPVKPLPLVLSPGMATARPRANTDLAPSNRHSNRVPGVLFDSLTAQLRHRSAGAADSSRSSLHHHQRSVSSDRHPSSSVSNTHHLPVVQEAFRHNQSRLSNIPDVQEPPCREAPQPLTVTKLQPLAPPAPELVSELLQKTRQCIHSVILYLRQFGIPRIAEDEEIVDNLIFVAITAVRDLLYVSGPSVRHFGGKTKVDRGTNNASQTPLVPAQRRVVATLSKFVLSARAVLNDGPWTESDDVSQLSSDAEELDRSVVEFVSIAQGVRNQEVHGPRRLHGYLAAPHADPAKAGAGTAGTWKGFGWVDIEDDEEAPRQNLTTVVFNEFVNHMTRVQLRMSTLTEALRATQPGV